MDFEDIARSVRIHFCPQCKASFGCVADEDGDCDCEGAEFDWKRPWCPPCVQKEQCTACPRWNCTCDKCSDCDCTDCKSERRQRDSGEGPFDESGPRAMTQGFLKGYRQLWTRKEQ
jgi:hypothetical protein